MLNTITFDVEEWFQVTSFNSVIKISNWDTYESRVVDQTEKLLGILLQYNTKATFFVLGYVAERHPWLIKKIADHRHEIAVHGYSHRLVCNLSANEFVREITTSKEIIEEITGQEVIGYRAPSFSISDETRWAFEILRERGFQYDSSLIPGGLRFKISETGRFPYNILKKGRLIEFPVSTVKWFGRFVPFSGGVFLRIFPYFCIKTFIKGINANGKPAMVYIHPWELDIDHPRIKASFRKEFIHYYNLKSTEKKLKMLLKDFQWGRVRDVLQLNNDQMEN